MFCSESLEINRPMVFLGSIFLMLAFSFPIQGEVPEYDSSVALESSDHYGYNGWYLMNSGDFEGVIPFYNLAIEIAATTWNTSVRGASAISASVTWNRQSTT